MPGDRSLDIGAGKSRLPGFETLDVRPEFNCDHICDAIDISHLGKFDYIYANMVLEHFKRYEYPIALKNWYEALNPGGKIEVIVPDFDDIVSLYKKNPEEAIRRIYGSPDTPGVDEDCYEQLHKWGFNEKTLKKALEEAGFVNVERIPWTGGILFVRGFK